MKRLLTRRWLVTHALTVALVLLFLLLGYWQLQRAQTGNSRSWAYTFEWPTFALFVVGFWIKIARDELHPKTGPDPEGLERRGARRRARGAARRAAEDPELAAYNRYIAELAKRRDDQ